MPCTTILVGKLASYDGSTIIARNDDAGADHLMPKKCSVIHPQEQPRVYRSVLSHVEIPLPENPMRYTCVPNALTGQGVWAASGVNEANVAMTATETITSNARVLGADPLVTYVPAEKKRLVSDRTGDIDRSDASFQEDSCAASGAEIPGGIGEEDIVVLVLPYIRSAREGVLRLGQLLAQYGTYEMNGIAFQDSDEIWWLETIGGHHWIAKRVPDDQYVVMPNQQGIDEFDLEDAFGAQKEHLCSADLLNFITENHLDLTMRTEGETLAGDRAFDVRAAFGSRADSDHSYNTPRAWYMLRYFNPTSFCWDGPESDWGPESDDLPWCLVPERKVTVEDVKYILSAHFQGTPYDPYAKYGDLSLRGKYRPIGINRNNFVALTQLRPYVPAEIMAVEWIAMASNVFNAFAPFYANVDRVPEYLANTGAAVSTESFYWANRLIGALADAQYDLCKSHIERYQNLVANTGTTLLHRFDREAPKTDVPEYLAQCNEEICRALREATDTVLGQVLYETSLKMKNGYSRADA